MFTDPQKKYLTDKFNIGEKTGRKLDPKLLSNEMRYDFPKQEWLSWSQIASFWSRLAQTRRGEATKTEDVSKADEDPSEKVVTEETCEEEIEDDPYFNTLEDDILDAIEENEKDIFQ